MSGLPADDPLREAFAGRKVLITGGLGFLGSNLAIRLVELGAKVTLLDAMLEDHGGNLFNIEPIKDEVRVNFSDIRDHGPLKTLVAGQDFVFHLAGQNDHLLGRSNPFPDIEINIGGAASLLETCRRFNPDARLIYSGTRGEYGTPRQLPVSEDHPLNPKGIYELSSMTAQHFFRIYHEQYGIRSVMLRFSNVYGERSQMRHDRFGVVNWFVRLAIDGDCISVYGDGSVVRDFLYVRDAVDAMIACATTDSAYGEVMNVGNDSGVTFGELAEKIVRITGTGDWKLTPYSPGRAALEPGDYVSDITKIRTVTNWRPITSLEEGLARTIAYYRDHKSQYW